MINAMRDQSDTYLPRVNHKRIERIWREEGLKVPKKSTKKKTIITDEGSCIRLRPEPRPNHIWSYDFVDDKTANGKKIRFLNIYDEGRHMCIASIPRRSWKDKAVIQALADAFILHGMPEYLRSDNGPEFTANEVKKWLKEAGVTTMFVEPGSPWQNGYVESFNARMRDEFLNGEIFGNMYEVEVLTKRWVKTYNEIRPHMSLRGRAPQTIIYPSIA
jgi:transposase InsO family protein